MECQFCRLEITEDCSSLTKFEMPNAAKFAKTLEDLAKIEKLTAFYFCTTKCQLLSLLSVIFSKMSPHDDRIKAMALDLAMQLMRDSETPEFEYKLDQIRKMPLP